MRGFGDILRLVAGQYGEISQDLHDLLKRLASTKAQHISLLEGRPVSDSEQGLILHHLRRRLSELPVEIFFEEVLKPKMKRSKEVLAKMKRSEEVWGPEKRKKEALKKNEQHFYHI